MIKKMLISVTLVLICQIALALSLPIYLDWRSSFAYSMYDLSDHTSSKLAELYKVSAGIDTLFNYGIRTRLELTNEEKRLVSQVIVKHAIIDYLCDDYEVQLSMQDYGYGKGFFHNERRNDHPFFDQNALVNYRWHGVSYTHKLNKHSLGLGMGSNDVNIFLSDLYYRFHLKPVDLQVFGMYAHKDSRYTTLKYHLGYDATVTFKNWQLRSGYVFEHIPEHKNIAEMEGWHLINELSYSISDNIKTLLSSEHQKQLANSDTDHLYEACIDLNYNKLQSFIGLNIRSLPDEEAVTYFLDLNFSPVQNLVLGAFFDYVDFSKSDDYTKIGLQTRYRMK